MRPVAPAFLLMLATHPAWAADPTAADYGIEDTTVSEQEHADDQRFGGYPNNRLFNNDSSCRAVIKLFDTPNLNPSNPRVAAYLSYSRVSLMIIDTIASAIHRQPPAILTVGTLEWRTLPALFPKYCRIHPSTKLSEVVIKAYRAARIAHGLPDLDE